CCWSSRTRAMRAKRRAAAMCSRPAALRSPDHVPNSPGMRACARPIWVARPRERSEQMHELYSLRGKNAVVTGAGAGIGRAIALAFARAGANVACIDLDQSAADRTSREAATSGQRAIAVACDVGKEDDVTRAAATVLEAFKTVHVLVNGAAGHDPNG